MDMNSLFRKAMMTLFLSAACLWAYAQQTVTGVVVDESGEPLIGVSIQVKGTTNGTITDFDGNFTVDNVKSSDVLVFSYIGYSNQEITVGKQTTVRSP